MTMKILLIAIFTFSELASQGAMGAYKVGDAYPNTGCTGQGSTITASNSVRLSVPGGTKGVKISENAILYTDSGCTSNPKFANVNGCTAYAGGTPIQCVEIGGDG
ncbi:unnamed protein product [Sympodiomycopsis kandeliae]